MQTTNTRLQCVVSAWDAVTGSFSYARTINEVIELLKVIKDNKQVQSFNFIISSKGKKISECPSFKTFNEAYTAFLNTERTPSEFITIRPIYKSYDKQDKLSDDQLKALADLGC